MLEKLDRSIWFLIGANLIPLVGVLFWDWSTFEVVALYWLENVIIGAINILKMITCSPEPGLMESVMAVKIAKQGKLNPEVREKVADFGNSAGLVNNGIKFFLIPFFAVHYGGFCLGHGFFVFFLLGREHAMTWSTSEGKMLLELVQQTVATGGLWAALGLLASHLYSFFANFIGKGEYRRTAAPMLMVAPYGRIVILHIAIIFGAFAIMALGSPVFLVVLLIAGKIILDIKLHLRSHRKLQTGES